MYALVNSLQYHLSAARKHCSWLLIYSLTAFATLMPAYADSADAEISKEYQVKAAFLYNIPKFVEWPAGSFNNDSDPVVIGVFGKSPFGDQLNVIVRDRKINGRDIVVKQVNSAEEIKATHLLFFSINDDRQFSVIQAAIRDSPVLTVGESASFAAAGGIINFVLLGDKVRFEINMASAERAGLKVSAQLQKLATTIRRTP